MCINCAANTTQIYGAMKKGARQGFDEGWKQGDMTCNQEMCAGLVTQIVSSTLFGLGGTQNVSSSLSNAASIHPEFLAAGLTAGVLGCCLTMSVIGKAEEKMLQCACATAHGAMGAAAGGIAGYHELNNFSPRPHME